MTAREHEHDSRFTISRDCGGRLRLLATIEERAVVEKILTHLGLPADPPCPSPARTPAWLPGVRAAADHEDHAAGHWPD